MTRIYQTPVGSQLLSPNVKTLCSFEPHIWPETITSRDAESACFEGSRTSCNVIILGIFGPKFGRKRSHHMMDASCRSRGVIYGLPCVQLINNPLFSLLHITFLHCHRQQITILPQVLLHICPNVRGMSSQISALQNSGHV